MLTRIVDYVSVAKEKKMTDTPTVWQYRIILSYRVVCALWNVRVTSSDNIAWKRYAAKQKTVTREIEEKKVNEKMLKKKKNKSHLISTNNETWLVDCTIADFEIRIHKRYSVPLLLPLHKYML